MKSFQPPGSRNYGFTIELETSDGNMALKLAGEADRLALAKLKEHVEQLHAELQQVHASEVLVDVRDITFMHSACFSVLVNWVAEIGMLEPDKRYRLILRHNPEVFWQRHDCLSLQKFAPDLVSLQFG